MKNSDSTLMPAAQMLLFVEVFPNGPADHLALYGQRVHVPHAWPGLRKCSPPAHAARDTRGPRHAYLTDAAVGIDRAPSGLLQAVTVLHRDFLALHTAGGLHVQLDPRRDATAPIADRHQPHEGLLCASSTVAEATSICLTSRCS